MRKKMLVLLAVTACLFAGCAQTEAMELTGSPKKTANTSGADAITIKRIPSWEDRFYWIEYDAGGCSVEIIVDKETRVQYLWYYNAHRAGGLTAMLDADGNPLLYTGDFE